MPINKRYNPDRHGIWCWYCHTGLTCLTATIDHIVPVSKGGTNRWNNLAWACQSCNCLKADLSLEEFRPLLQKVTGRELFAFEWSALIQQWFDVSPTQDDHRLKVSLGELVAIKGM